MDVVGTTSPPGSVDGLAVGAGGIWATNLHRGTAYRLDPAFPNPVANIHVGRPGAFADNRGPIAVTHDAVWVNTGAATVTEIDPHANKVRSQADVGNGPDAIAAGPSGVWVADGVDNSVSHIDPSQRSRSGQITPVGESPDAITLGEGAVWVANSQDDTVSRIDLKTGSVTATIRVGQHPSGVAVGDGYVWVANSGSGDLSKIDPKANRVVSSVRIGESPQSVIYSNGRLWVTVDASINPASATGRSDSAVRILLSRDPSDLDPSQYGGDLQRAYETCALLYNYPDQPAPMGGHLQPELATGKPAVSDGGRTYTFTIRKGFRFSPPSPQPVTAAAFQRAIERNLNPAVHSYAVTFMSDIVGASDYIAGRSNKLPGVRVHGDKLVIRLVHPSHDPSHDLVARLSTPWFCAVPPTTPDAVRSSTVIPSAGPYYVASYVPNQSIQLRRNPNYGGSRPQGPQEIDYEIGVSAQKAIQEIRSGEADYYSSGLDPNGVPPALQKSLAAHYGPGSEAARTGVQQYFLEPTLSTDSLMFNMTRPPFDEPRLRRAVNFAIDRRALASKPFAGSASRPTDQYIPPGVPGFLDAQIYPLGGPDLERARKLAGNIHRQVVLYTCNLPRCLRLARIVRKDLAPIGLGVRVRDFPLTKMFAREATMKGFDLALWGYIADFPDPADFVNFQFDPRENAPWPFRDPAFVRRMHQAAALTGHRRYSTYAKLEHDLVRHGAPAAAYANATTVNFFSSRIGCQVDQAIYGIDLGRLCIKK
jgi:peptide/nickel transport system substrate-binding protein